MNITRFNFFQQLPLMQQCIKQAEFVAMDFEFTGVLASPLLRNSTLDSFQMRYWKAKESVRRFMPLQLGLCTFQRNQQGTYIAHPFNIYIFPFAIDGYLDKQFWLQSSSLSFLADNNFDFNKTFYQGVFYLSHQDEQVLREAKRLDKTRKDLRYRDKVITFEMKGFYEQQRPKFEEFLNSTATEFTLPIKYMKYKVLNHMIENFIKEFPEHQFYVTYDSEYFNQREKMIIIKGTEPVNSPKVQIEQVADYAGVRVLLDQISEQRIPLVMHNGLLDIYHAYDKFYYNLPDTHQEFKQQWIDKFPLLYDTKYMINQSFSLLKKVNGISELKNSYQLINEMQPMVEMGDQCQEYSKPGEEAQFEHEAGFDAYMTGCVFVKSRQHLNVDVQQLFRNKLPMGSIKVPFNLEQQVEAYHGKNTRIFHLQVVENVLVSEEIIKQYFLNEYNEPIDIFLSYGQNFEYFFIFQNHEINDKFMQSFQQGKSIITIGGQSFIASEYETYVQRIQRRAKHEMEVSEMSTILEL